MSIKTLNTIGVSVFIIKIVFKPFAQKDNKKILCTFLRLGGTWDFFNSRGNGLNTILMIKKDVPFV
jgi:hypothetical protein